MSVKLSANQIKSLVALNTVGSTGTGYASVNGIGASVNGLEALQRRGLAQMGQIDGKFQWILTEAGKAEAAKIS